MRHEVRQVIFVKNVLVQESSSNGKQVEAPYPGLPYFASRFSVQETSELLLQTLISTTRCGEEDNSLSRRSAGSRAGMGHAR